MVASGEKPCEENTYACSLVEKLMFVLSKRFADDLIRQTCADMYFNKNDNRSLALSMSNKIAKKPSVNSTEIQDLISNQTFPANLNVINIFNTIKRHDKFDFLTNKYMATASQTTPTKNTNHSHPDVNLGQTDQLYNSNSKSNLNNININTNLVLSNYK